MMSDHFRAAIGIFEEHCGDEHDIGDRACYLKGMPEGQELETFLGTVLFVNRYR